MSSYVDKARSVDLCVYLDTQLALCLWEQELQLPVVFCMDFNIVLGLALVVKILILPLVVRYH